MFTFLRCTIVLSQKREAEVGKLMEKSNFNLIFIEEIKWKEFQGMDIFK